MQIHELNTFSGTLGAGAYLAIDNGTDTGKISSQGLLAATEARIDNIIAGPAPSAEEIVDARLGADGVTYPSLGDAIRDQVGDLKSEINYIDNNWVSALESGSVPFKPTSFRGGSVNLLTGAVDFINPPTSAIIDSNATLIKLYSDSVRLKIKSGMQVRMVIYNPDKTYNTWVNWNTTTDGYPSALQNKKGYYVRIFASYTDSRQLSQEDFYALTEVYSLESENASSYVDDQIARYGGKEPIGNILNPLDFLVRGYYLDFEDGFTHVSTSSNARMSSRIYTGLISGVCIRQQYDNDSTATIAIYCYDDEDNYLGYSYVRFNAIKGNSFALELKKGTTSIAVYSGALDSGASHLCVSLYELNAFTLYSEKDAIKKSALPDGKLTNKVIVNFGDSIFGNHRPASDISTQIALKTGATVYNLGFGGCRMSATNDDWSPFSMQALAESIASNDYTAQDDVNVGSVSGMPSYFVNTRALLESIDFSDVDIATISYGTNDFTGGATLDNESNPLDRSTICGALRYSIETLLTAYPNLQIYILTPTYRFWLNGSTFVEDSNTKVINGIKLTDIVDKYIEIAKAYNLPVIDDYYELGINKFNRSRYFPSNDGTHHNNNGVVLIAEHMINELF